MKFLIYLLGYLIYPFSFLIPRKKNKWAFGSPYGLFEGNAKYLFIYVSQNRKDIDAIWYSLDKNAIREIRALGFNAYYSISFKALWHTLRSKYWFFNAYATDILFFTSGNAVCVNLWHGVGLKKIEFSIKSGKLAERYVRKTLKERFFHPGAFRRPDFFLSTTNFQSVKFAEAFRLDLSRCLNIGYPRNTILLQNENERKAFIKRYEPESTSRLIDKLSTYNKVFIYMPTWRDSKTDTITQNMDFQRLNEVLKEKNHLLLLKLHGNIKAASSGSDRYSNIMTSIDKQIDVYTILPYTHVLITDYSSILYDYILMKDKDVILYIFDYKDYINERDFNYPFFENTVGKLACNFDELLDCIKTEDYKTDPKQREAICNRFWNNNAPQDICNEIITQVYKP